MPMIWVPPEPLGVLEQNGVFAPIFRCYRQESGNDPYLCHFTFDGTETRPEDALDIRDYVDDAKEINIETIAKLQQRLDEGTYTLVSGLGLPMGEAPFHILKEATNVDPDYAADREDGADIDEALVTISYTFRLRAQTWEGYGMGDLVEAIPTDMEVTWRREEESDDGAR